MALFSYYIHKYMYLKQYIDKRSRLQFDDITNNEHPKCSSLWQKGYSQNIVSEYISFTRTVQIGYCSQHPNAKHFFAILVHCDLTKMTSNKLSNENNFSISNSRRKIIAKIMTDTSFTLVV